MSDLNVKIKCLTLLHVIYKALLETYKSRIAMSRNKDGTNPYCVCLWHGQELLPRNSNPKHILNWIHWPQHNKTVYMKVAMSQLDIQQQQFVQDTDMQRWPRWGQCLTKPLSTHKSRHKLSAVSTSFARLWLIFQTIAKSVHGNTLNRDAEELTPQQQLSNTSG